MKAMLKAVVAGISAAVWALVFVVCADPPGWAAWAVGILCWHITYWAADGP